MHSEFQSRNKPSSTLGARLAHCSVINAREKTLFSVVSRACSVKGRARVLSLSRESLASIIHTCMHAAASTSCGCISVACTPCTFIYLFIYLLFACPKYHQHALHFYLFAYSCLSKVSAGVHFYFFIYLFVCLNSQQLKLRTIHRIVPYSPIDRFEIISRNEVT